MRAFVDTEVTKPQLVASLEAHRAADRIVQGIYWERRNGDGHGCGVGCSIHDFAPGHENEHKQYETLFGVPAHIAHLEDRIFENLPAAEAREWPLRFARAIPEGADLSMVWPQMAIWLLTDPEHGVLRPDTPDNVRKAVEGVAGCYSRRIAGDEPTEEEWGVVGRAAWAARAARAAWDARDAWDARAAWDARDAWDAWAAWAAWAARAARVKASADKLIELLETAPVTEDVAA